MHDCCIWYGSCRKLGVPYFGVLIIRILLFRVLYWELPYLDDVIRDQKVLLEISSSGIPAKPTITLHLFAKSPKPKVPNPAWQQKHEA